MKYGFIGCGNMGGALAAALSKKTKDILLASKSGTAVRLALALDCKAASSNEQIIRECDVILLGVKPQMMEAVLSPLANLLAEKQPILISMAAGISLQKLERLVGIRLPMVRIMPNTPASIGKGMITYCCNDLVSPDAIKTILSDFSEAGRFDEIPEGRMDAATAAAGSTPAYTYMFIEAIADGAVACGLPRPQALEYAAAAVAGAAELLLQTKQHPGELKDAVCSPGGSTIAGVRKLEAGAFRSAVLEAIIAAYRRNLELGD